MFIPVLNNAWSEAEYDRALHLSGPTLALRGKRIQSITQADNAVSAWASRVGTISFTQATAANKPKLTRGDNVENRLLYSEDISQSSWAKTNGTVSGTTQFVEAADVAATHSIRQATNAVAGQTYTLSFEAKPNGRDLDLRWTNAFTAVEAIFTLNSAPASPPTVQNCTATQTAIAGGWFAITVTATATTTSADARYYFYGYNGSSITYNGDGASGFYLRNLQVRSALADPTYLPTTSAPQYRGVNGRPAVLFDGVDDYMTSAATLGDVVTNAAKTVMVAGRTINVGAIQYYLTENKDYWSVGKEAAEKFRHYNYDANADYSTMAAASISNAAFVLAATHSAGNIGITANGIAAASAASGNTGDTTGTLVLGKRGTATSYLTTGPITDLLTWNKVLHSQTIDKLTRLAAKERGASLR